MQRDHVSTYFERTYLVLDAYDADAVPTPEYPVEASFTPPPNVERFRDRLTDWMAFPEALDRSMLKDATRLNRSRYELQREINDFTEGLIETIRRPAPEKVSWETATFELVPASRIVQQTWDWIVAQLIEIYEAGAIRHLPPTAAT